MAFRFLDAAGACAACLVLLDEVETTDIRGSALGFLPYCCMPVSGMLPSCMGAGCWEQLLAGAPKQKTKGETGSFRLNQV